ncbi:MAG: AmmeMemoRadiSam system radical SAM enzyme [Spirochaetales bacterium]|nr:AmmeMemoRadiSam system radical SAM enzyme [Spirochaetales bacterium]
MKAKYYKTKENRIIACTLCPHQCVLLPGKSGICRVRENQDGHMALPFYGKISALALDPIEKKPLYHFFPGKMILSVGFWGCNLRCPFCQNYSISQKTKGHSELLSPQELVKKVYERGSFALAYTYSEPLVHWEYLMETVKLAREAGIKNVLVSNGHLEEAPARELLAYIDAANIDLKGFQEDFYAKEIKGSLEAVKNFIRLASEMTSLEVTTLVIPGKNNSPDEIEEIAVFLASLNREMAYHLSAYYPCYEYDAPPTEPAELMSLGQIASKHLSYVYLGNIGADNNTYCLHCGNLLVLRKGYSVKVQGIANNCCAQCGKKVPIISE